MAPPLEKGKVFNTWRTPPHHTLRVVSWTSRRAGAVPPLLPHPAPPRPAPPCPAPPGPAPHRAAQRRRAPTRRPTRRPRPLKVGLGQAKHTALFNLNGDEEEPNDALRCVEPRLRCCVLSRES